MNFGGKGFGMSIFKSFVSYYKPYRKMFYFDLFCALVVSLVDLAFPQILNFLTDGLYTQNADVILRSLWIVAIALIAMYIVRYGCQYYITTWGHAVSYTHLDVYKRQILLSASNAFALFPSMITVITTERDMATKIPTHSRKSASPPLAPRAILTASAISPAAISICLLYTSRCV